MADHHKKVDVAMNPKRSFNIYPRPDNVYEHKSSYNFDMMRTRIFVNRKGANTEAYLWVAHCLVGVFIACISFAMTTVEDELAKLRADMIQFFLDENLGTNVFAWLAYTCYGMFFVLIATLLTIYVGPGASGSGIPEIMALLNGINVPLAIGARTLFVKCVGTIFAVSAGLCIGKEGPLAHIGANVGALVC